MPKILAFSSSLVTLKFSVHNIFETRVLLKIFDAEFPHKLSHFEPLCLPAKMAAETVIWSIKLKNQNLVSLNKELLLKEVLFIILIKRGRLYISFCISLN